MLRHEVPNTELVFSIDTGIAEIVADSHNGAHLTLYVNGAPSSFIALNDPQFLAFEYMQQMDAVMAAITSPPEALRALHLGAAGCCLARCWDAQRPGSRQVAVDVDARLVADVREWFDLPRAPRLRLRAGDALDAMSTARPQSYDVIVRDVYAHDATPAHLITLAAAEYAAAALRPGGVYLVNCADRPPLRTARREVATLAAAFGPSAVAEQRLALIAEPGILKGRRYGNLVIAAVSSGGRDLASAHLERALRALPAPAHILLGQDIGRFVGGAKPIEA
jgi:spermidine synthase